MAGIDRFDYEASQKRDRRKFNFTVNFKKIYMMNNELFEDNSEWDENYPKNIFLTMLAGIWVGMTALICISKGILFLVTVPFIFFYGMAFFSTYKAWKEYKYKKLPFWLMSIFGLIIALAVGIILQIYVIKL